MRKIVCSLFVVLLSLSLHSQEAATPDKIYGDLFKAVQLAKIFPDNKTFVDAVPKRKPTDIMYDYGLMKGPKMNLKKFVEDNFQLPVNIASDYKTDTTVSIVAHIKSLWKVLKREPDATASVEDQDASTSSTLLPLPNPYIVPGGRFREIYYWDSYFTMLGLKESGENEMIEHMVNNFAFLISQYGHIPNGNRTYYLSRSQPPFFSLMLDLLASIKGNYVYATFLPALQKEYDYFNDKTDSTKHVVKMPDGSLLNRYYDQLDIPRQESYVQDYELTEKVKTNKQTLYRDLRSAAESGWDFSSRWFRDGKTIATIQTTNYIPVDLNCLLYHLEKTLARAHKESGDRVKSKYYDDIAARRKKAINKYCWSPATKWYVDYNFVSKKQSPELTLAGMTPFFLQLTDETRMNEAKTVLETKFLKAGGVVATLKHTGEQWDAPNGWAPLTYMTVAGLENYNQPALAKEITKRWIELNTNVYKRTGKLMEKYNVVDTSLDAGGGEYASQDGFGWTNGVLLALISKYGER